MQATDWACFLTRPNAGIRMDISKAMMEITTNSSMSVKPFLPLVMTIPLSRVMSRGNLYTNAPILSDTGRVQDRLHVTA
jgi:hypothetical protein